MLKVRCNRIEFDLNESDEIMYNGACYQIITRKYREGWNHVTPVIPMRKAQYMIRNGLLVLDRKENRMVPVEIYKINVHGDES